VIIIQWAELKVKLVLRITYIKHNEQNTLITNSPDNFVFGFRTNLSRQDPFYYKIEGGAELASLIGC
jgi:hypothetical protein